MIPSASLNSSIPPISSHCFRPGFSSPRRRSFLSPPSSVAKHIYGCESRYSTHSSSFLRIRKLNAVVHGQALNSGGEADDEVEYQVMSAVRSKYNDIVIIDTPKSRMLLLDSTHNIHSIVNKGQKWTGSYWDEFASLPAIVPKGLVAIFGLGAGTAAHLMLDLWPSLQLDGWEIDEILIDKAREYFGLSDLERHTQAGGILNVCVGDALSSSATVPGGYAGIIIDLFSEGKVLPQLQEVTTWLELKDKLMPNGRLMVKCGVANDATSGSIEGVNRPEIQSIDGTWERNSTIQTLCKAFPGQLSWKKMGKRDGENYLALTGPLPDLIEWSAALPDRMKSGVKHWRSCCPL